MTRKVVLMGQFGVGKTSITRRYLMDIFETDYMPTLGVQIKKKILTMPSGKMLSMIIWDLEGFSSIAGTRASYLLGSNGFVYVFDITRPFTYLQLKEEHEFIKNKYPQVNLRIVGNKKDLGEWAPAQKYLEERNIPLYGMVSAKTGEGIQELFSDLANSLVS